MQVSHVLKGSMHVGPAREEYESTQSIHMCAESCGGIEGEWEEGARGCDAAVQKRTAHQIHPKRRTFIEHQ